MKRRVRGAWGWLAMGGVFAAARLAAAAAAAADLPAPDYASNAAWAARPDLASGASALPRGVAGPADAGQQVDVFFIHPTTDLSLRHGSAAFDAPGPAQRLDDIVLPYQASVFNACCRIFAPRYRQASLGAITHLDGPSVQATELAYSDVQRAFDYYLAHDNHGRPFIIAGHSQGANHGLRLLQQRIVGTPLMRQLVAAYLPGGSVPSEVAARGLPVCATATSTGCLVSWNSVRAGQADPRRQQDSVLWWDGHYQAIGGRPLLCVNPLNWTVGGSAPASLNLGGVYFERGGATPPAPVPAVTGAACEAGLLGVEVREDERRHFSDLLTLVGIYHDFDIGLFYLNIRDNARVRSQRWLAQR